MVILFATPFFRKRGETPKGGGLEAYLFRVAGALKEFGHTPIIVSLGTRELHYVENGIEIHFVVDSHVRLGQGNLQLAYDRFKKSLIMNHKIKEMIKERHIDIIQFTSVYGLATCYNGKIPAVMRMSSYTKLANKDLNEGEKYIKSMYERLAAHRCNAVYAPSNVVANAFAKDIHRKVSVIEPPFWNDCVNCDSSMYEQKLSGKKYVLFMGNLGIHKGTLVIANILHNYLKAHPEYYFVYCGEDWLIHGKSAVRILREKARAYKDRLIYLRTLPHSLLYPVIQHADFVICPSLMENLSNACMEAMYFGRVVIGTDGASFEQLIDDGISGFLCRPGDEKSLLHKMNDAASMSDIQKKEMGKKARERIDQLAPKYMVRKLLRYYRYVIIHVEK